MNSLLSVGLELALRPLDAQVYAQNNHQKERPFELDTVQGDQLVHDERNKDVKVIIDSVLGHGRRCALVRFQQDASEPRQVFAKFFWQQTSSQFRRLHQELNFLLDKRLDRFRMNHAAYSSREPPSDDENGPRCLPKLLGLYAIDCQSDTDPRLQRACILLLELVPPTFRPIHHIDAALLTRLGPLSVNFFSNTCFALKLLHQHGYLHGDVSRGNFLLSSNDDISSQFHVILVDFERSSGITNEAAQYGEATCLFNLFIQYGFSREAMEPIFRAEFPREPVGQSNPAPLRRVYCQSVNQTC
ncbi:hypothetical protein FRC15_004895 [Serendipita sp. 397]|nr:hypothetical protein FRC15_004895 [Serendipita sp. 397]